MTAILTAFLQTVMSLWVASWHGPCLPPLWIRHCRQTERVSTDDQLATAW